MSARTLPSRPPTTADSAWTRLAESVGSDGAARARLDGHVSRAEALQRAQLLLLRDLRYRHPRYWSPFLLISNWL